MENEQEQNGNVREEMQFNGDIIITDPCYIIKHRDESNKPKLEDYFSYDDIKDYPDYNPNPELPNGDVRFIPFAVKSEQWLQEINTYRKAMQEWEENNPSDWEESNAGLYMDWIGLNHCITHDTLYGDWSCTVFDLNSEEGKEKIGEFCADAGMVGVFDLDEVLLYNPDFDYHINRKWTTAWIKDFEGTVQIKVVNEKEGDYLSVVIEGHGVNNKTGEAIDFFAGQTGF